MLGLFKCEFKKFNSTYINSLSLLGMLSPVILVFIMFLMRKSYFVEHGSYNWTYFNDQLAMFFIFLVGPIITSFIAVFSVFYEYQMKTMKNLLSSPHGRIKIIISKMIYVSAYVILQYLLVAAVSAVCALVLRFDITWDSFEHNTVKLLYSGLSTVVLVPLMMFITLLTKSFIPAMVITVAGTISNVLMLNWEYSYVSPWSIPADIALIAAKQLKEMDIVYPLTGAILYFILFVSSSLVLFRYSDQHS